MRERGTERESESWSICLIPVLAVFDQIQCGLLNGYGSKTCAVLKGRATRVGLPCAVSALRSASRVQNTNTNCPQNRGLLSEGGERARGKLEENGES